MGKLISRLLANRLTPRLSELVHPSQSAFVKKVFYTGQLQVCAVGFQTAAREEMACPAPEGGYSVTFDSVAWPFLLEVLQQMGFPRSWIDWVSALLALAHTKVLLNGVPGEHICHARGLYQGDPLSPMMFILVMEVLSALIHKADSWVLWQPLGVHSISHHASLYVDDLILFISPSIRDLQLARSLLSLFEKASGLSYNFSKCQMAPIRCKEENLAMALAESPCS
jgi:hypothetical protein